MYNFILMKRKNTDFLSNAIIECVLLYFSFSKSRDEILTADIWLLLVLTKPRVQVLSLQHITAEIKYMLTAVHINNHITYGAELNVKSPWYLLIQESNSLM